MMTSNSLAENYVSWLAPQVRDEYGNPSHTYWDLITLMHGKEFVWLVPNDDNRVIDGISLRVEFCYASHISPNALKNLGPCSFLELLVGLSRRLAFAAGGQAPGWAWQLLNNLELQRYSDPLNRRMKIARIHDILDAVIWRTYQRDGGGGFFPLMSSEDDQTKIEIWYQMSAYIEEIHPEY